MEQPKNPAPPAAPRAPLSQTSIQQPQQQPPRPVAAGAQQPQRPQQQPQQQQQPQHLGVYVCIEQESALFTVLLPDNTYGMFIMSSPRDVVYAGFTTYKVEPGRILVQVQNPNPNAKIEAAVAKPTGPRGTGEYMVAQFTPGLEYNLKSEPNFPPAKFVLVSRDISYWQKIGGFSRFGEARPLKGMQDFDAAHEIKKALVAVLQTYGPILSWT